MRWKNAYLILAVAFVVAFGIFGVHAKGQDGSRLGRVVDAVDPDGGQNPHQAERDLYVKPKPDVKPDHQLKKRYPELFGTEAVVLAFSSQSCAPCRRQKLALLGPSKGYNILKVDRRDDEGELTRWGELMETWELGTMVPVVVVVENGEVVKKFVGYTSWRKIKPHAAAALKVSDNRADYRRQLVRALKIKLRRGEITEAEYRKYCKAAEDSKFMDAFIADIEMEARVAGTFVEDVRVWIRALVQWFIENWDTVLKIFLSLLVMI